GRQLTPGGTDAFNLGVDFQGGTVITAKFKQKPGPDEIRAALNSVGVNEPIIQDSTDKTDEVLIKIPLVVGGENGEPAAAESQPAEQPATDANANTAAAVAAPTGSTEVDRGRQIVKSARDSFGREATPGTQLTQDPEAAYQIVGTDSVGPIAGKQLRDAAVIATLLGMIGMLLFIAFRYDWTYAAGAVIAVFHDVLVTLALFSLFQWEISLTVLAALLTLVGFSVNDSIVIFDRIRENLNLNRTDSLYNLTNKSINQTMSRTIITNGLTFLAVLAL